MSKEEMKLSMNVNGHSKVPPGFRFHPTEEELLHYYLRKKVAYVKIDLDVIREVDLNKLEPWDIQDMCNIGTTQQNDWYFFSHKDKKYPTGTRTNRATAAGFWKATGRDKVIRSSLQRIGMRKTLVFYKGRAPRGQKSDWIMHEYRLDDENIISIQESNVYNLCDYAHEDAWVVCRVFKKKNYHRSFDSPKRSLSSSMDTRSQLQAINKDGGLEQLLMYMDSKSCKQETNDFTTTHDDIHQFMNPNSDIFLHLLGLDSPTMTTFPPVSSDTFNQGSILKNYNSVNEFLLQVEHEKHIDNNMMMGDYDRCSDWEDLDKFVASHLDDQMEQTKHFPSCYGDPNYEFEQDLSRPNDLDIWSLARSLVDPICHVSV